MVVYFNARRNSLYDTLTGQAVLVNVIGFFILALGVLVYFALQCKEFRRGLFQLPNEARDGSGAGSDESHELLKHDGPGGRRQGPLGPEDDELEEER